MNCPYCRTENEPGAVRCRSCTSWISPPALRSEWYRARENRMIGGVARGLSNRFAIPVAVLRLAFLLSIALGGWGILLYVAAWIAMPLEPQPGPAAIANPVPASRA